MDQCNVIQGEDKKTRRSKEVEEDVGMLVLMVGWGIDRL